jgi:ABC-type Fe3+-hydroxamate transport system substrate-binding protein
MHFRMLDMARLPALAATVAFAALVVPLAAPVRASAPPAGRIVSLLPSLTEDLFAIGAGPSVVAVSQYTDFPAAATRLPQVASFTSIDAEAVVRLHPDLVIGMPAQAHLVADLTRAGVRVELIGDESYDEIFTSLARLGELTGHEREARELATRLRARTAELVRHVPADRPSAFVVLDTNPIVTTGDGSYIGHLIELAGGVNAAGDLREAYPRFSAEALVARQPDAIVADRTSGLTNVLAVSPWNALRAVRDGRVYVLADADILERPGPRYNEGLAWLIARLHPHAEKH